MVLAAPGPLLTPPPSSSPPKTPHRSYSAQTRSQNEEKKHPPVLRLVLVMPFPGLPAKWVPPSSFPAPSPAPSPAPRAQGPAATGDSQLHFTSRISILLSIT